MFLVDILLQNLILVFILILIIVVILFWRKVPADKAMVITGLKKRVLTGKGGFIIPFFETSCIVSLENISMTTDVKEAPSQQGIFVDVTGTAVVKVENKIDSIYKAVEQFCNGNAKNTTDVIRAMVEPVLEGRLRGIVSTMTVEQINNDRYAFEKKVEEDIKRELSEMGLQLISYSILQISTQGGYLENRARPQVAQSKADAEVAEADIAYSLKEIEKQSEVEKQKAILAEQEAIRVEKELVAKVEKPANAEKRKIEIYAEAQKVQSIKEAEAEAEKIRIEAFAKAEAKKIEALADAEAIKARGEAEALSIKAKGIAEAEAKDRLADAMAKYGEAAIVEMLISKLPEIMSEISKPMSNIDKITVIDTGSNGNSTSKISKTVTDVAGSGFEVINDLTGIDISEVIKSFIKKNSTTPNNTPNNDKKVDVKDFIDIFKTVVSSKNTTDTSNHDK